MQYNLKLGVYLIVVEVNRFLVVIIEGVVAAHALHLMRISNITPCDSGRDKLYINFDRYNNSREMLCKATP